MAVHHVRCQRRLYPGFLRCVSIRIRYSSRRRRFCGPPPFPSLRLRRTLRTMVYDLVIIGGGINGAGTARDAALRGMSVALFERGVGERLLITGVHATTTKKELKAIAHGGPRFDCCADLGWSAANTHGNAAEAAAWVKVHRYHRLMIVTASYHMPRSLAEFGAEMPDVTLESYPVEPDGLDLKAWWRHPRAWRLLQIEYVKYLASVVLTHVMPDGERDALDRGVAHGNAAAETQRGRT